jgi:hypothetical protein
MAGSGRQSDPGKEIDDFRIFIRALTLARAGRLREAADVLATARPPKSFDVFRAAIERLLDSGSPRLS